MKVGLIVDSACDLPHEFIRKHGIFILPLTAKIDNRTFVDDHDPATTQDFYDQGLLDKGHQAETEAFSAEQIRDLFLQKIVPNYDVAICETVDRSRSKIYENATEAMNMVMAQANTVRAQAGIEGNFTMRVIDSKQLFAGQGLLAAYTLGLLEKGLSKNALRHQVETFSQKLWICVVPRDLHYIRERARRRGDKSVSGVAAFLGKALNITPVIWGRGSVGKPAAKTRSMDAAVEKVMDYAVRRIQAGLLTPTVSLSCGMNWDEIEALPGLDRLKQACADNGVELLLSRMGITSSIYIGPGSICLSLAAEDHEFED
ncbi:EDD domain protein, DegV family [Marinobacter daqiaonensis]|uniref:EDD domain protein, DegV family n=1 Tax=Marinobacter daqiaonensis TaxID=650891 RepID=A0A1I6JC87_9GAMM|nr:DegV family protein [Marinobacter daqiaonensis]SFR76551.1 EDD domain protein, DegV family [Marinobacter daqiaonensis]